MLFKRAYRSTLSRRLALCRFGTPTIYLAHAHTLRVPRHLFLVSRIVWLPQSYIHATLRLKEIEREQQCKMHQSIVITGVSRGLGLAMAEQFIERGHTVLGCARSPQAIQHLAQRFGQPHRFAAVDVSDPQQVNAWAEQLRLNQKSPSLLINNAGLINQPAPLWEVPVEEFAQVLDVNITGTFNMIRAFVPAMIQQQSGLIVNFSSGWGRSTSPDVAPYCATKWAIEGLTQALAQELPAGVGAIALNPGIIHTEMLKICFGPSAAAYPSATDWAKRAVPFLLKLKAKDNGHALTVPG
jgi:NAD(P)-dependent dehydrogenase (short-subunit alcohol dehydrogenase family)